MNWLVLHLSSDYFKQQMSEVPSIFTDNEEKPLRDMPCVHISLESLSKYAVGSKERDEHGFCRTCGFPIEKHYTESQLQEQDTESLREKRESTSPQTSPLYELVRPIVSILSNEGVEDPQSRFKSAAKSVSAAAKCLISTAVEYLDLASLPNLRFRRNRRHHSSQFHDKTMSHDDEKLDHENLFSTGNPNVSDNSKVSPKQTIL